MLPWSRVGVRASRLRMLSLFENNLDNNTEAIGGVFSTGGLHVVGNLDELLMNSMLVQLAP